nr:F-box only protein 27 isoform X1 [Manis javanica]
MGTWASRGRPAPVPAPDPEPEQALDLSQLPPELLLVVLSHVPPRTLLGRCRRVCRGWRALVDGQALWLLILARDHGALLPLARSCLPPAREARPCLLGRFCERSPIGRNLIRNPCGQEGLRKWMVQHGGDGWVVEENRLTVPGAPSQTCFVSSFSWCRKKQILDLEEEGLWPELLDSGKIEICVSDWWGARHDSGCMYRLIVQLLDANQIVLDKFSAVPDPIQQWNNNVCLQHSCFLGGQCDGRSYTVGHEDKSHILRLAKYTRNNLDPRPWQRLHAQPEQPTFELSLRSKLISHLSYYDFVYCKQLNPNPNTENVILHVPFVTCFFYTMYFFHASILIYVYLIFFPISPQGSLL